VYVTENMLMSSEEGTISRTERAIGNSENSVDKKASMWVVTLSLPAL
jgi:hypothetical protein